MSPDEGVSFAEAVFSDDRGLEEAPGDTKAGQNLGTNVTCGRWTSRQPNTFRIDIQSLSMIQ